MIKWFENISLRGYNSFGVDARAKHLVSFTDPEELTEILPIAAKNGDWAVLGGGNNILFTKDYEGTLIHPCGNAFGEVSRQNGIATVKVDAGVVWDDFVAWCIGQELWGAENLSHIPSQVGAAPVQNIGAYGVEAKDIIKEVEVFDTTDMSIGTLPASECGFGYRESIFKSSQKGRYIITAVTFELREQYSPQLSYGALSDEVRALGGPSLANIRQAVINIRQSKLPEPSEIGNAGSFFKNPVVDALVAAKLKSEYPNMPEYPATDGVKLSAGWLIEQSGWKGKSFGNAGVYAHRLY